MNVHESSTGGHETLPVRAESRDVSPSDPVLDGELVDDLPRPRYSSPQLGRFASWWLRSPRVPVWLKDRRQAVQAGKDLLVSVLRAPDRFVGAVVRGLVAAFGGGVGGSRCGSTARPLSCRRSWPTSSRRSVL